MFEIFRLRKKIQTPENPHNQLIARIRKIATEQANACFSPYMGSFSFRSSYKSIRDYNFQLSKLIIAGKHPDQITGYMFLEVPLQIKVKDWFVHNGMYVEDPVEELRIFQERCIELVSIFVDLELSTVNAVNKKALDVLAPFVNQISEITTQLVKVTTPVVTTKPKITAIRTSR